MKKSEEISNQVNGKNEDYFSLVKKSEKRLGATMYLKQSSEAIWNSKLKKKRWKEMIM